MAWQQLVDLLGVFDSCVSAMQRDTQNVILWGFLTELREIEKRADLDV